MASVSLDYLTVRKILHFLIRSKVGAEGWSVIDRKADYHKTLGRLLDGQDAVRCCVGGERLHALVKTDNVFTPRVFAHHG